MPRPRMNPDATADKSIHFRVTLAEQEMVRARATAAGMRVTDYVRRLVLAACGAPTGPEKHAQ